MLFNYLQFCLEQVVKDNELGALKQALDGAYVEPGGFAFISITSWAALDPEGRFLSEGPAAGAGSVWHQKSLCSSL